MGITLRYFRLMLAFCLCLGIGFKSFPAAAAFVTGEELVKECQSSDARNIYACMNYVAGVIDYQLVQQSLGTEPSVDFCLPDDISIQKAAVTVMLYLEKNPMQGTFIAAPAVTMALQQAYPCAPVKTRRKHHSRDE